MSRKSNSVKPIGIVMIVLGLILFLVQISGFDLFSGRSFWPLFIIIPGAVLLAVASLTKNLSAALAPLGMMITLTGCVLAYQNWADHYQSWAYAWIITGPFALGAGLAWHGRMHADDEALRRGRRIAASAVAFFLGAAAVFELVINHQRLRPVDRSSMGHLAVHHTDWCGWRIFPRPIQTRLAH